MQCVKLPVHHLAEENRLVLVHSCIREEQSWVLEWNNWRRWHKGVCMLLGEEVNELLAHIVA